MRGLARGTLPSPAGYPISFLSGGTPGGPRIVLVHGTPGDAMGWADYVAAPPAGVEVVAIDRPGFGQSGPDAAVPSLKEQAAALLPFLETRNGRKPILVGHSLGGPIVAQAALDYPGRIGAIVLAAAALDPGLERIHWAQYVAKAPPVAWLMPRTLRNANDELMALQPELETLSARLGALNVPVVVIHGDQDDLVPVANVAFMRQRFPKDLQTRYILLTGMNHFLPWGAMDRMKHAIAFASGMAWGPP